MHDRSQNDAESSAEDQAPRQLREHRPDDQPEGRADRDRRAHVTQVNRKVLWVVLMVLVHPVAVVYSFMVFNRVKRGSLASCPGPAPVV